MTSLQKTFPGPEQEDRYAGIRALWLKVIIRAVFDWVTYRDSHKLEQKKMAERAASWLFDPPSSDSFINSFESICDQLDISPKKIRAWASTMTKDQVTKIEHLDRSSGGLYSSDTKLLIGLSKERELEDLIEDSDEEI